MNNKGSHYAGICFATKETHMHFLEITGAEHKTVKRLAGLKEKKYRERYGEFLVEGEKELAIKLCNMVKKKLLVSLEIRLED